MLASIPSIALASAIHSSAMVVAVDCLTICTGKLSIANALAIHIIAMVGAYALFTAFAFPACGTVADAVHALTTHAALFEALCLLTINTLVINKALALATLVTAVATATQRITRRASETCGASTSTVVALALAAAIVRARLRTAVLISPAVKALANAIGAFAMGIAVGRACHDVTVRTSVRSVALALALSANALVAAGTVDLATDALHRDVQQLVAALAAAVRTEKAVIAHARSRNTLAVVAAVIGAVWQSAIGAFPAGITKALTHLSAVALASAIVGATRNGTVLSCPPRVTNTASRVVHRARAVAGANHELASVACVTFVALAACTGGIAMTMALILVLAVLSTVTTVAEAFAVLAYTVVAAILRTKRSRAIIARIASVAVTSTIAARPMIRTVMGASSHRAILAGPAWVAETHASIALALGRASVRALLDAAVKVRVARVASALVVAHACAVATALVSAAK